MFERFSKSGLSENWLFKPVSRLDGTRNVLRKLRSETAVQPVARITFEPLEQRVLLSADINPAFGALAIDPDLDAHLAVQDVGASYVTTSAESEVDLDATAVPTGPAPEIASFDLTILDGENDLPGSRVQSFTNFLPLEGQSQSFTLDLQGGQTLSLTRYDGGDGVSSLTLLDPDGELVASSGEDSNAIISAAISAAGTYTVVVDRLSGSGYALVTSVLNAALEIEGLGGPSNDTVETAQSLDASAIISQNGGKQYAVIGDRGGADLGPDVYSFSVNAGDIVSIFAGARDGYSSIRDIRVLDETGREITGENAYGDYSDDRYTDNILIREGMDRIFVEIDAYSYSEYSVVAWTNITPSGESEWQSFSNLNATGFGQGFIGEDGGFYSDGYFGEAGAEDGDIVLNPLSSEPDDTFADANYVYLQNVRYPYAYEYGEILNVDGQGDHDVYALDLEAGDYFEAYAYADDGEFAPWLKLFDEFGDEIELDSSYFGDDYYDIYGNVPYSGTYYLVISGAGNEDYDPNVAYSGAEGSGGSYSLDFYVERYNWRNTSYFSLNVVEGDEITLTTLTPDDVAGLPFESPDPVIEFSGYGVHEDTLVIVDAGDGRNDVYTFIAQYTGEVRFSVHSGFGEGTVQVIAEGSSADNLAAPVFTGSSLPVDGTTRFLNDQVYMYFDTPMFGGDVDGPDLLVNGVAANSGSISGSTVHFDISGLIDGDGIYTFELVEDGLSSLEGGLFAGTSFTVTYDTTGATVQSSSPANGSVSDPGMTTIALTFSEEVNAYSITPSTFGLVDTSGGTAPAITSVTRIDDRNVILNLAGPLEEGAFQLNFQTTFFALRDRAGNNFATQSIGFVVDGSDIILDDLMARIGSQGLGSFGAEVQGTIFDENDVDTYTFSLSEDQAVSFLVHNTGAADVAVTLEGADGSVKWTGTAATLGSPAAIGPDRTLEAGDYAIKISGVSGESVYNLLFMVNTDIEDESIGGASNDGTASAQALESLRSVGGGETTAIVGTLDGANSDTADFYAVTLAQGERLDVVAGALNGTIQIALLNTVGSIITTGAVTQDARHSIGGFIAPSAGTYFLRVTTEDTAGQTRYQLGVAAGIALQIPLDNQAFNANGLPSLIGGLGGTRGFGGNAKIAVVGVSSSQAQFQTVVDQLNDSTEFSFDASLVFGADVDTQEELNQYDLIILSNTGSGQSEDAFGSVAQILPDWVASGGGVIMTGWGVYGSSNETTAVRDALNQVLPINLSGGYSWFGSSTNVIGSQHPVTDGLTVINGTYFEYPRSGLASGAIALGGSIANPTIAVREVGLGRSVYLGGIYAGTNYGSYNTGAADQLLEQAAAWAGGTARLGQLTLDAVAGQELRIETSTPADDAGLPENDGDLLIRLYAPDGSQVAENANGAADGRNALLTYTIPNGADGTYQIEIRSEGGRVQIDYLLSIDGNTQGVEPLMTVVDTIPDDGAPMQTGTNIIDVNFSRLVDITTLDASDMTVDGGAIVESVELLDGDTARFTLSFPDGDRTYAWSMAADAVRSIAGTGLESASGSFIVDETPPWVSNTSPESTSGTPFNALTFVFDEEVDPASVSIVDIVFFTRPDGVNILSSITSIDVDGVEVTVSFNDQYQAGAYQMTIGPNVLDLSGNLMQSPGGTQTQFTATINIESPDLEVTNIVVPENVRYGEAFDVTFTVTNTGGDPASANWYDRVYLANTGGGLLRSLSTPYRPQSDTLGNLLPPLLPGASYTQTVSVTLPINDARPEGAYQIGVLTDVYGAQNESDNNNNTAFAAVEVTYPPLVDLVVEPFQIPVGAISGQELPLTWTVTNDGDAGFDGTFYDRVYLSSNGTSLNTYLGQFIFSGPIAAGESVTRVQNITLPDTIEGDWFIRIVTDYFGNVSEGPGESNNQTSSNSTIDISLRDFPNLIVTRVETPDLAFSSAPITVEWTVENVGEAATNSPLWYDRVYLSLDDVAGNDDDIYLGQATNPSFLNPGGSYRNSLTATLPRGIEGPYFIVVRTDIYDNVEEFNDEGDNNGSSDMFSVSLTPPPDLQVTNAVAPLQAFSGSNTTLTYTVSNEGDGRTLETAWWDRVYLSLDDEIDADDFYLGDFHHTGRLEAGQSYDRTVSVSLPVGQFGDYLFLVQTDFYNNVYENVYEGNNVGFDKTPEGEPDFTTINLTPPPDLEIVVLDQPDPFYSGRAQTLTYEVANIGATSTLNLYRLDQVWMSNDGVLDDGDVLVGSAWRYGFLQSGEFQNHAITVTLPSGILGDRTLILVTDADRREFELNKDNNVATTQIDARILAADLAVTAFDASDTGEAGGAISVGWTVTNNGEGNSVTTSWSDAIVISEDEVFGNSDDRTLSTTGYFGSVPLAPGASYSRSGVVAQLPFDLEGQYFVFLRADSANQVFENGRLGNNVSAPQAITVIRNAPDLVASNVAFQGPDADNPSEVTAGRNLSVQFTVTNEGVGKTEATRWYDGIYLSADDTLDPSEDILIGRHYRVNRLDAGQSYNVNATVFVPIAIPEGDYKLIVRADLFDNVSEEDGISGNNIAVSDGVLSVAGFDNGVIDAPPDGSDPYAALTPDLTVESVTASENGLSGQPITVNWTVRNEGPQVTGPRSWYDTVYLSLDQTLDTGSDIRLGFVYHNGDLGVDESYDVTRSFTVPRGIAGEWFVFVRTDAGTTIGEVDETNNVGLTAGPTSLVLPAPSDLVAGTITVPESGVLGAPVTFTYTVTNEGENAVLGQWQDSFYLSGDDTWDIDDALITTVTRSGPVASGESYTGTITAPLPGVLPGDYKIIVRSDIRNAVPESSEANNDAASEEALAADAQVLEIDTEVSGVLAGGQTVFFKLTLPEDETIRVTLDREGDGASELYAAFGTVPTRSTFENSARDPFAPDQIMTIPSSLPGEYYLMVFGQSGASTPFTLRAETVPFGIEKVDPVQVGTTGLATIRIEGARFSDATTFELVDSLGTVISAVDITIENSALAFARFDTLAAEAGFYELRAKRGDLTVALPDAIFVSDELGDAIMLVNVTGPASVRPDRINNFQVNFANVGGADTRAPLILVTSSANLAMGISGNNLQRGGLQVLGSDIGGPIDIFRPGAESVVSVVYRTEGTAAGVGVTARAITASDTTAIENFDVIETQIRPLDIADADWNAFWARIQPRIGATWGQYVEFLNNAAVYVEDATGEATRDIRALMGLLYDVNPDYLPSVTFSGRLVGADGAGVAGVTLLAYEGTDARFTLRGLVETDADGAFTLSGLPAGTYQLRLAGAILSDGVPDAPTHGFDVNLDGLIDETAVFAEIPGDEDVSGIDIRVLELPTDAQLSQATDPVIAADSAGRLHMVWNQDGVLLHSVNDGSGWGAAVAIADATAFRAVQLIWRPGEGAEDELVVLWTNGEGNQTQAHYAVGTRIEGGLYAWSSAAAIASDPYFYGRVAAGVDADGEVVLLFTKSDAADDQVDSDIYTQTLGDEDLALPYELEIEIEDPVAFASYLQTLSDEQLEALGVVRFRGGWNLTESIQLRADGTLRYDNKEATLGVNAAARVKFKIGSYKFEIEGRAGGEAGWYVNDDTCSWEFQWGKLNLRLGGAVNIPLSAFPATYAIGNVLYYMGVDLSMRGEVSGSLSNVTYTDWGQFPFSPVSSSGSIQGSVGVDAKFDPFFLTYDVLVRGLVNFKWDVSSGWNFTPSDPFVFGSLLVRKEYRDGSIRDITFAWPSGSSGLSLGGSEFSSYTLLDVATGEVTVHPPLALDDGDVTETIGFLDPIAGSLADLAAEGQTALTQNLTDEHAPDIATSQTGDMTGVWLGAEGIMVSEYDSGTNLWGPAGVAIATGGYDISNLTVSYDGDGDKLLIWNELDISGIFAGMSTEEFDAIRDQGGTLVFSVYDAALGTWSEKAVLHDLTGTERGLSAALLSNGDILASWTHAESEEAEGGNIYAAVWNAATDTWSTPTLLSSLTRVTSPVAGELAGEAVVMWSDVAAVANTTGIGSTLRMMTFTGGVWVAKSVEIALPVAEIAEESTGLFTESVWNVESVLPEPDQEECECEDDDCDDDEDDYDPPVLRPSDPNDILGPDGFGEENWVTTEDPYGFTIRFENEPTASAPAQVVVISQEFDTDLNINSFRVDDFGWGDLIFEVDATSPFFQERYDFTDTHGFLVDVVAGIDILTGIATWTISTIDPETGEPPLDAEAGFLPINDETGRGEGFVKYAIQAGRRVETGTRVDSKARIVFDTEAPIDTPPIFHTLDVEGPESSVNLLPERQDEADVVVSWTAQDDEGGSGVGGVDVFVSMNGGEFELWLENTTLTEATWEGVLGNSYAFYSVARDNAGWQEEAPDTPDATIDVGQQPGRIAGVVFEDSDGDGMQDEGETGLANFIIFLDINDNGEADENDLSVLSDADGVYVFEGLQPGTYSIAPLFPDSLTLTTANADFTAVDVVAETTSTGPGFGLFEPGTISGVVFRDGVGAQDGVRDQSEPGLGGWTVWIDSDDNGLRDEGEQSTVTDFQGAFSFVGLGAGTALLRVEAQSGYRLTTPAEGAIEIAVTSGIQSAGNLFGFKPDASTISGVKYEDANGNGQRDEGEGGLSGWTVFLDADGDGQLDDGERFTVTSTSGSYSFDNLAPGTYIVAELPRDGWVQTFPGAEPFVVAGHTISTSSVQIALDLPSTVLTEDIDLLAGQGTGWADDLTGLTAFRSNAAFADVTGARTTVVTIDSGIDLDHGFFGPDRDGNGRADRILFSYDFADNDANASDRTGHGTGVAGIIAGDHSQYGGLAPEANLISLKVFSDAGAGYFADLERALQWVALNGATYGVGVVNLSIGDGGNWSEAVGRYGLGDELAALADMDIIVIAASGNSFASFDTEGVAYPAADPSVIGVGAVWAGDFGGPWYFSNGAADYTTDADRITAFTQRDENLLDVLAPGARFITAGLGGGLATVQGTSHAAAYMSGVATLAQDLALREFGHRLSAAEFSALLSQTATFVFDGDDEEDNVVNTGLSFPRVDMSALADAILSFVPGLQDEDGTSGGETGGGSAELIASAGQYSVTVGVGETVGGIDFGSFELVTLSGVVFDDDNLDGLRDTGEAGVEGVVVYLDANDDGLLNDGEVRTQTDGSGAWSLGPAGPGTETVRIVVPDGLTATRSEAQVDTASGVDVTGIDFGIDIEDGSVATLTVASVTATRDGFTVRFSEAIDPSEISVNGSLSDVVLRNAAGEIVRGSLIFDADAQGFRFVTTKAVLSGSDYTLTLRSGANGFVGVSGTLDGDSDGVAGDNFTATLTGSPTDLPVLSIADVARAAGQSFAQGSAAPGVPVTLNGAQGLTGLEFTLGYDPSILSDAEFFASAGLPLGAQLETVETSDGLLRIRLTLTAPLASDVVILGHLGGQVAPDAPAGVTHLLDVTVVSATGVGGVVDDDGLHVLALPGDIDMDGAYTTADVNAINALSGGEQPEGDGEVFDKALLGDMDGDGDTDLHDTMLAFRASVGIFGPNVPALPPTGSASALKMAGAFDDFGLGNDSGSSVTQPSDPFGASDPFAVPDPIAVAGSDPFAASTSFTAPTNFAAAPLTGLDPFASLSQPSVFGDPFGAFPAPVASNPFATASLSTQASTNPFGAFPPFPT